MTVIPLMVIMGTISEHRKINKSLSFKHEKFNLGSLDDLIAKGFGLVKKTELLRCKFTPLWNELMKNSGAIVLETPHFQSAMNGLLMKVASDLSGNLYNNISIKESQPFISIAKGENELSSDSILIIQAFQALCQYSIDSKSQIEEIESSYLTYTKQSNFLQKDHERYFSSNGVPPCDINSSSKKLTKYLRTFKSAYDISLQMKKYMNEVLVCLKDYEAYCKNKEVMAKFERIGKEANKKSMTKPTKIMFKFSPEKKIGNYEDYYDRVIDYTKIEKNCQQMLSFYSLTVIKDKSESSRQLTESLEKTIKDEERNKMIEECKEDISQGKEDKRECKEFKKNCDGICESQKVKMEFDKEIENGKKEKEVTHNNMIISNNQLEMNESQNLPEIQIRNNEEDEDDIIDNIDSETEYIQEIEITIGKQSQSIVSFDTLHLKETINIYPQSNVYSSSFAFVKEQNILVTGLSNGAIIITDLTDFTENKTILRHNKKITSILYLNDNKTIITGSEDGNIYKHTLDDFESTLIGSEKSIDAMVNLLSNNTILVASDTNVIAYDYAINKKLYSFKAHDEKINDMAYYTSRDMLVTCSKDKKIKLWNCSNQECIGVLKGVADSVTSVCYAQRKDHLLVVSTSKDGFITFWNLSDKNLTKNIKMKANLSKVLYLENQKNILGINDNNTFTIFDLDTNEYKDFKSDTNDIRYTDGIYFINDSKGTIALGTNNSYVQFWYCS